MSELKKEQRYKPGTEILAKRKVLGYKTIPPDAIVDEHGETWIKVTVLIAMEPFELTGYKVILPNLKIVPVSAEHTMPCD